MRTSYRVLSWFQGRLEIPGKKEPLFLGGTHVYSDTLPEKIKYYVGEGKMTVTEVDEALKAASKELAPMAPIEKLKPQKNSKES